MSEPVVVGIPVLRRPQNAPKVVESLADSVRMIGLVPVFLCTPGDVDEIAAVADLDAFKVVVKWDAGPGDFARKHNVGVRVAKEMGASWYFMGADDLVFHPGWADHAIAAGLTADACVVGTNDLGNRRTINGDHSTHSMVHVNYLDCGTVDEANKVLHEGYDHQFVDDEFVQTARWRKTYVHAYRSIVEHLHPDWGKGQTDDTYTKGKAMFEHDRALYNDRKRLWGITR